MSWPLYFDSGVLLISLTLYVLTGGADYGGGAWELLAVGRRARQQRELLEHAIGPIWEADHVWLILVVVILFTAFPPVYATLMMSLHIPVTAMLIGIVLRGSAFSFRSYGVSNASRQAWGRVFAIASLVTPLLLGMIVGAIASGKVPENPRVLGDFVLPWTTPFCFGVGFFALALFAYLSATYATVEADSEELRGDFRIRAIAAALAVGVMAGVVMLLSINGAPRIWQGLTNRFWTWPLIWATTGFALAALYCLWTRHYAPARILAAAEATLIIWGWAFAQYPHLLEPDLTIFNASAPPITLRMLAGALAAGAIILLPSYRYLMVVFKSRRRLRKLPENADEQPSRGPDAPSSSAAR